MPGKPPQTGPTSDAVAENLTRLRTEQNLTFTQVSERLNSRAHWKISPIAVRNIETGQRGVSVDDLVALAIALGVSPATLLMPAHKGAKGRALVTGTVPQDARNIWNWLTARNPLKDKALKGESEVAQGELIAFWLRSWPSWEHDFMAEEIDRRKQRIVKTRRRIAKSPNVKTVTRQGADNGNN